MSDTAIKGIIKKNGGLGDTRNLGASLATGEYLLFIDSDDFYEDHCLEGLIEYADEKKADKNNKIINTIICMAALVST